VADPPAKGRSSLALSSSFTASANFLKAASSVLFSSSLHAKGPREGPLTPHDLHGPKAERRVF
jgi:hypothetical protein